MRLLLTIVGLWQTSADIRAVPELPITLSVLVIPTAWLRAIGATLALAVGVGCLLRGRHALWQTTLQSAWWWSLAALVAWSLVELATGVWPVTGHGLLPLVRCLAIALSLCPAIAILGAKRPQAGAWNFVVLSLWVVLVLPALETLLLRPGQTLTLGVLRGGSLAVPAVLVLLNYGGTRYWSAAALLTSAQFVALSSCWWPAAPRTDDFRSLLGLLGIAASLALACYTALTTTPPAGNRLWVDFRDTLGAFWALRVAERMNATVVQQGCETELTWSGFRSRDSSDVGSSDDCSVHPQLQSAFRSLLRRFVSNDWIEQRLPKKIAAAPESERSGR